MRALSMLSLTYARNIRLRIHVTFVKANLLSLLLRSQVGYDVTVRHESTSSSIVQNGTIEWIMPSFLMFANHAVEKGAVTVTGSGSVIHFKVGNSTVFYGLLSAAYARERLAMEKASHIFK